MTYEMSAQQIKDVLAVVDGLNAFDNPDDDARDVEGIEWGSGLRAVLGLRKIPVHSDYRESPEHIGYLMRGDFGWGFTQRSFEEEA